MQEDAGLPPTTIGSGLRINNAGVLTLDCKADLLWLGTHVFNKPISFPLEQAIPLAQLTAEQQQQGALPIFNANQWGVLNLGEPGHVLTAAGGKPTWGVVDLKYAVSGILSLKNGGTGLTGVVAGGLLHITAEQESAWLAPGTEGQYLGIVDGQPQWVHPANLTSVEPNIGQIAFWQTENELGSIPLTWDGQALHVTGTLAAAGLHTENEELILGNSRSRVKVGTAQAALQLYTEKEILFSVDHAGTIIQGHIALDQTLGVLNSKRGGTGLTDFSAGDLLYAQSTQQLERLSTRKNEGKWLQVVDGFPCWMPLPAGQSSAQPERTLTLVAGTSDQAPLQFKSESALLTTPTSGAMEWDGKALYFTHTANQRREIAYIDSNIQGLARNISEVLTLAQGGLGANVASGPLGALLCRLNTTTASWLPQGEPGLFLASQGADKLPEWHPAVTAIQVGAGLKIDITNLSRPFISLDLKSYIHWLGDYSFENTVELCAGATLRGRKGLAPLRFNSFITPTLPQPGDVWFDGQDLFVRTESATVNLSGFKEAPTKAKQVIYLPLISRFTPTAHMLDRCRVPVPYAPIDGLTKISWNIKRIEFRADVPPKGGYATINIKLNGMDLLDPELAITDGQFFSFTTDFNVRQIVSGDLFQVSCGDVYESDCWAVYVLLETV